MFLTVYKIENDQNGKIYIGCSKDTKQRLDAHRNYLNSNRHPCKEMQADYNGDCSFTFSELFKIEFNPSIIYEASEAMHGVEAYYTIKYNSDLNGYNNKHVAVWRTRAEARPINPETVLEAVKKNVFNHNENIEYYTEKYSGDFWKRHRIRYVRTVAPSDLVTMFFRTNADDLKIIKARGLTVEDVFRRYVKLLEADKSA